LRTKEFYVNFYDDIIVRRRSFLTGVGGAVAAGLGAKEVCDWDEWSRRASVFIAKASSYQPDLETIVRRGLLELRLCPAWVKGKTVLLKPNLVEASGKAPHINTHPAVIRAVATVFRSWGAQSIVVAEGPGHCSDTQLVLDESGLRPTLRDSKLEFVDLNHDDVTFVPNRMRRSSLQELALPATLKQADLIVSLPKMKTHHCVGVTLSLKNLFGVMPGVVYGWPKNVLHFVGIGNSILDIAAAVRPHLAIVDGIIAMEGDGPIMGTAKPLGVLVMGTNLTAVDATCVRLMGLNPWRVGYLRDASGRLGPVAEHHIEQRGEAISAVASRFEIVDDPSLNVLRS
jgi:uncharacterized protein (DUF362 family)